MQFQRNKALLLLTLLFLNSFSFCQSNSSQNIEITYPSPTPPTSPLPPNDLPLSPSPPPPPTKPPTPTPPRDPTSKKEIAAAIGGMAASAFVVAALVLFLFMRYAGKRNEEPSRVQAVNPYAGSTGSGRGGSARVQPVVAQMEFATSDRNVKGVIIDEEGLDAVYWRKLEASKKKKGSSHKDLFNNKPITSHQRNFSRGKSSSSNNQIHPEDNQHIKLLDPKLSASDHASHSSKRSQSGEVSALGKDDASLDEIAIVVSRNNSKVWDKISGSFQFSGDMLEALFGTVAKNRKPSKDGIVKKTGPEPSAKISILDSQRSENISIVIRSLSISGRQLIDALLEGRGLNLETLEKLTSMAPTKEETIQILAFDGEVGRLSDAESFLYHLLNEVPNAFTRVNAMLFRYTYGSDIQTLKGILQTLDSACTELRSDGVFLKLLEAILKAGKKLNAGSTRGDANVFNLTNLHKLSDYKSSDGKTTLLHFVVHEVVRNIGRRSAMNRNNSLTRSNSQKFSSSFELKSKEEQEREFLKLGLPVIGGVSTEFSNVLKSASIDYNTLLSISASLKSRVAETRQLIVQCGADGGGEFIKERKEFLEEAEREIKAVQKEETKVMEFVKNTTQYYQSGVFKDKHPLELFSIVKDFLDKVDKACVDITRSLQLKRINSAGASSSESPSSPTSPPTPDVLLRMRVTFPSLPVDFFS